MEKNCLIVGRNSFIAKHTNFLDFDRCSYDDLEHRNLKDYDVIVNCALHPLFKTQPYREEIDIDFQVGKMACESGAHYVMLSTSKVYGTSKTCQTYDENSKVSPYDYYGENKLNTELKLLSNFGNKITILRGSNIFGYEYGRNSFMGYCMTQLVNEGRIKLTMPESEKRDFLYVHDAVELIRKVCDVEPFGIYNLSSGVGTPVGTIVNNLINGYEHGGYVEVENNTFERQFILDNAKLKKTLDIKIGPFDFAGICNILGESLCRI